MSKKDQQEFFEIFRSTSDKGKSDSTDKDNDNNKDEVKEKDKEVVEKTAKPVANVKNEPIAQKMPVQRPIVARPRIQPGNQPVNRPKIQPGNQPVSRPNMQPRVKPKPQIKSAPIIPKAPVVAPEYTAESDVTPEPEKVLLKDEVHLKQETIIISAVAATFLSLACFFIGYKVGYNKGYEGGPNAEAQSGVVDDKAGKDSKTGKKALNLFADEKEGSGLADVKRANGDLWTLRIISYKNVSSNLVKATNLAKAIKNMTGYNSFVAKTGNELIVCVGKFKDKNDQKLFDLQIKMADLVYDNKKQFKSCYPVKLR